MKKNNSLQILRTIAAGFVIIDHAIGMLISKNILTNKVDNLRWNIGGLGVCIFFIISGYIMMETTKGKRGSANQIIDFLRNRMVRIVPMYWIATTTSLILVTLHKQVYNIDEIIKSYLFIPYANRDGIFAPLLPVGWTLNFEVFFYFVFSITLLFKNRRSSWIIYILFLGLCYHGYMTSSHYGESLPSSPFEFLVQPIILLFAVGMMLSEFKDPFKKLLEFINAGYIIYSLFIGQLLLCAIFCIPSAKPFSMQIVWWIPSILLVFHAIVNPIPINSRFQHLLCHLGDASYSTYLFHVFAIAITAKILICGNLVSSLIFLPASFVTSNLMGLLVDRTVAIPLTSYIKKKIHVLPHC